MNQAEKSINFEQGIATLPTILVLTALVMSVGILLTTISGAENSAAAAWSASNIAGNHAGLGARDGLLRVARNKNLVSSYELALVAGGCSAPYEGCASVVIAAGSNPKKITSTGRVGSYVRKVIVDATIDQAGQVTGFSWTEK